jgi:hypothetical protein
MTETNVGDLVVRIKADATQLESSLKSATQTTQQSANTMAASLTEVKSAMEALLPAFSAVALIEFGKSAIDSAENLTHMADRIGFTVQTLSALQPTLEKNGSSVDEFATSVNFLNRNLGLAASGNAPQLIAKFDQIGLSVTKLMALNPEQRFFAVAQALGQNKDQASLASDAFLLMGRGVAGLLPTLKETGGDFDEVIKKAQDLGQVITPDKEQQIRAFESAWVDMVTQMKVSMLDVMPVLNLYLAGIKAIISLPDEAEKAGEAIGNALKGNPNVSSVRPATVTTATHDPSAIAAALKAQGIPQANPAAGTNSSAHPEGQAKDPSVDAYITQLKEEAKASDESSKALFVKRAELEANTKAESDFANQLRSTKSLTDDELQQVDDAAAALYDHKQALEENKKMGDELTTTLDKIVMNFKDMKSAIKDLLDSIAQDILKTDITGPLGQSISGLLPTLFSSNSVKNGLGPILGFAGGGDPPVGVPSMVGENGPELFVPRQAGTIVPNGAGGSSVIVQQSFNFQPGLAETVNAALLNAMPGFMAATHASVFQAMQKGGSESRIAGLRK